MYRYHSLRALPTLSILPGFTLFISLLFPAAPSVSAQRVYSPEKGSAERAAILDALRVPVEKELRQRIVFVVDSINVSGVWAFAGGKPTTPEGEPPRLKGTKFEGEEDFFDNNFFGLLKKTRGKWKVVTYALGCTDVCYADWWRRFRAPKAIFPYTE